jgi:hypothetical protein
VEKSKMTDLTYPHCYPPRGPPATWAARMGRWRPPLLEKRDGK